jgi:DeoR/GlpR family transcriptional regulator of sugar metabolism
MTPPTSDDQTAARGAPRARLLSPVRHGRILELLRSNGVATVAEIAQTLAVSEMTVRRDLVELDQAGRLSRIHGGAVARPSADSIAMDDEEPTFAARLERRRDAKARVAAAAFSLIANSRTIALDVGTSTFVLAESLKELAHAKIFTNSLRIANVLAGAAPDVYLPGGRVRGEEMAISGPTAIAQFEALWFDVALIGVSGVTAEGLFDYSPEDTEMKRVYLRRAGRRIVLCDSSKFRRMSLVKVGALAEVSTLITEAAPPPDVADALTRDGVEIVVAPELA